MININLYYIHHNEISRYFTDHHGTFICEDSTAISSSITDNAGDTGDGICDKKGFMHFVLQTINGSLIYLRSNNSKWIKYELFRSRSGFAPIKKLRLCFGENELCAFYIMEYNSKNLMVIHRFSETNPYTSPEVVDYTDSKRNFDIYTCGNHITLVYRSIDGSYKEKIYDMKFREVSSSDLDFPEETLFLKTISINEKVHFIRTVQKRGYNCLIYGSDNKSTPEKTVTFGVSKNCEPVIFGNQNNIIVQWYEERKIFCSQSCDNGKTFSKPQPVRRGSEFAKIRIPGKNCGVCIEECAVFKKEISAKQYIDLHQSETFYPVFSEKLPSLSPFGEFNSSRTPSEFISKLSDIDKHVTGIETKLTAICKTLDEFTKFKKDTMQNDIYIKAITPDKNVQSSLSGNDIGEKNMENIEIFENSEMKDDEYD